MSDAVGQLVYFFVEDLGVCENKTDARELGGRWIRKGDRCSPISFTGSERAYLGMSEVIVGKCMRKWDLRDRWQSSPF